MGSLLPLTRTALATCEDHLTALRECSPPVEPDGFFLTLITRSLIVSLCSEVEQTVEALVLAHIESDCGGTGAANLIRAKERNLLRNARFKEICAVISSLEPARGERLKELVTGETERAPDLLGNAVRERDDVNHGTPQNITYEEFITILHAAESILDAVQQVLLPATPTGGLATA